MRIWHWIGKLEFWMAAIAAGLVLLAIMFATTIGVFGRYVLHVDLIPGGYNLVERILFPLLVFWALPLAHREGTFPKFDMVTNALPPRLQLLVSTIIFVLEVLIYGVVFFFVTYFVVTGIQTNRTMQIGVHVWPLWPIAIMMPIAFGLMLAETLRLLWIDLRSLLAAFRGENGSVPPASQSHDQQSERS